MLEAVSEGFIGWKARERSVAPMPARIARSHDRACATRDLSTVDSSEFEFGTRQIDF